MLGTLCVCSMDMPSVKHFQVKSELTLCDLNLHSVASDDVGAVRKMFERDILFLLDFLMENLAY